MTNQEKIVAKARSFIGTKWRHRGRTKRGIDCIGLVVVSVMHGGFMPKDRRDYGRVPWQDGLRQELIDQCGEPVKDWQPGDIALMRWEHMPEPAHVGIIGDYKYGGLSLIHSFSLVAVTEHIIDQTWVNRIIEVYRACK